MQAMISANRLIRFQHKLTAGKMYSVTGFDVARCAQNIRPGFSSWVLWKENYPAWLEENIFFTTNGFRYLGFLHRLIRSLTSTDNGVSEVALDESSGIYGSSSVLSFSVWFISSETLQYALIHHITHSMLLSLLEAVISTYKKVIIHPLNIILMLPKPKTFAAPLIYWDLSL